MQTDISQRYGPGLEPETSSVAHNVKVSIALFTGLAQRGQLFSYATDNEMT